MDRLEKTDDFEAAIRMAFEGFQAGLWTALPAIVQKFNASKLTVEATVGIKMRVRSRDGKPPLRGAVKDKDPWWWAEVPLLVDVPVVFPSGGGFCLTFPLFPGDPVLVVFSCRSIDAHWQSGGVQPQAELRMHNLSDGFAIPGHRTLPKMPEGAISESSVQLRSDDGQTYIELTRDQLINVVTPGEMKISASKLTIEADLEVTASQVDFNGDGGNVAITANGKIIDDTHTHTGVQPGTGITGPVS